MHSLISPSPSPSRSYRLPLGSRSSFLPSLNPQKFLIQRKKRKLECRAELAQDAPFVLAIGGCVLNSLVFPVAGDADEGGSGISSTDARFAVMGIISFIPYFNWLSWVFAWMDSGRQRYLVYSLVYLAPYLRTNLSLSPDESWLPLSSIIFCIAHIQLEASIMSGDVKTSQLFDNALKFLLPAKREEHTRIQSYDSYKKGGDEERMEPTSSQEESGNKLHEWGMQNLMDDAQHQTDNQDQNRKE